MSKRFSIDARDITVSGNNSTSMSVYIDVPDYEIDNILEEIGSDRILEFLGDSDIENEFRRRGL